MVHWRGCKNYAQTPPPPAPPAFPHVLPLIHRYNEFNEFYDKLKRRYPDLGLKLPGKRFLGNNFDPEFIKARREGLHDFISRMMKVGVLAIHCQAPCPRTQCNAGVQRRS